MIRKICAGAAFAAALTVSFVAHAATPVPQVSGPIPVTAASHPFGAANQTLKPENLAAAGYVEEEYFVSGKANVYDWQAGGAVVRTADVPYTTRVLVRRPKSAGKFSGRVIVEMMNPTNLLDLNIGWAIHRDELMRRGDAWVGLTAKPIAVKTLQTFDPARYAPLNWANPLPASDPRNCAVRAGGDTTQATENGLVWDMNTQVGAWIRSNTAANPFTYGGRATRAKYLYGWGYSQTGGYLYTYVNAIHPLVVKADGKSMFDGYLIATASGPSAINQCAPAIPAGDPHRKPAHVGVPVMHVMTNSDYAGFAPSRLPDNNTLAEGYRDYDLSGAGHATPDELYYGPSPADITKGGQTPPPVNCTEGPRSRFPSRVPFNAILENLEDWVEKGKTPPPGAVVLMNGNTGALDEYGNVKGGVRTPYLDVPTSTWAGNSTGPSFCRIAGHETPFTPDRLKALYPTHADYVRKVEASVDSLVAQRYITRADGAAIIAEARATKVP